MNARNATLFAAVAAAVFGATRADAAIMLYTDRSIFLSDLGTPGFTEDFESFATDTQFRTTPVAVMGGTFTQEGQDQNFRNYIDVAPSEFTDGNGTDGASLYTNRPEGTSPGTFVRFSFISPNQAFGLDT